MKILTFIALALTISITPLSQSMTPRTINQQLLKAARNGDRAKIESLITEPDADINTQDMDNRTPLHLTAAGGSTNAVEILLSYGADINAQDFNKDTPLHVAALEGHVDVIELLLKHGANIDAQSNDKSTPLRLAAEYGHRKVIELLLKHGADINAQSVSQKTPLHSAAIKGHSNATELLLKHLKHPSDVNAQDNKECTALHSAAHFAAYSNYTSNYTHTIELLLKHGADINAEDTTQQTPLHHAAINGTANVVIEQLIAFGCVIAPDIAHRPEIKKAQANRESLLKAVNNNDAFAVIKLLRNNAYADTTVKQYLSTKTEELFDAIAKDDSVLVKQFLKMGFSLNITDRAGNTLLHKAFYHKSKNVLKLLLSITQGTDNLDAKNNQGLTPIELMVTTSLDYAEFLQVILTSLNKDTQQLTIIEKILCYCAVQ
ncbi:ankyrin repeat domain-containing protein [Candidatus Dependentiae bacterium]|nr:ankyrin repeat domain-containing protein [Candidatus Dependentiae bacterium]